jgi:putative membrane protein
MHKTLAMMGVLAFAATAALAQSTSTTPEQSPATSGQSGSSASGQSTGSDSTKGTHSGHGMTPADSSSSASRSGAASGSLSPSDRRFIETAARGGLAEVDLGRLGTEKASSADVKAFAQTMVDDHSKANDELKTLASQKGLTLPTGPDASHKAVRDRLEKLSGDAFDRAFIKEMLKDHKKVVAEFQKQAGSSRADADVKSFAEKTLPKLQQHLEHAQQQSASLDRSGGTSATSTSSPGKDDEGRMDKGSASKDKAKDKKKPDNPDDRP